MAGGRAGIFWRRRRMPHGLSFPADAADLYGDRAGGPVSDHRHPAADAGYPGELPMGAVPAQPRRTDAGNGHRRRARLSVVDLRQRSPRAHQCRHPPPACAADGQRPAQDRADELAIAVASRARRSSITATRSAWATTSISATATACARRCNGRPTAMADSPAADPARLYAADHHGPGLWLSRPSMSRRSRAACLRC